MQITLLMDALKQMDSYGFQSGQIVYNRCIYMDKKIWILFIWSAGSAWWLLKLLWQLQYSHLYNRWCHILMIFNRWVDMDLNVDGWFTTDGFMWISLWMDGLQQMDSWGFLCGWMVHNRWTHMDLCVDGRFTTEQYENQDIFLSGMLDVTGDY